MRVKCLAERLTGDQRIATQASNLFNPTYQITVGQSYIVLGINLFINSSVFGKCCLYMIQDDAGRCVPVPSVLVEIIDWRVSSFWRAKQLDQFDLTLWPEELYQEFFHDDLSEGNFATRQLFQAVVAKLESEFAPAAPSP
jgi:hypothetical protein